MSDTYNITIKCDSIEERDIVLEKVDELVPDNIVRYRERNNVFFSENDMEYFNERMREVT
tara:strand:- start:78 stop:257 length:180 start_codon:yes stop_codon:yes gene_type:complete